MATSLQTSAATPTEDTRFDRRLAQILAFATAIFAEKGYEGASMRDLSRASGISLAGLYYYFESKEKLLYFIQRHTFKTIIERLRERLAASDHPEERVRIFVHNHVDYAIGQPNSMKVLSHEDDVLQDSYGAELAAIKREYYRICLKLVEDLIHARTSKTNGRGGSKNGNVEPRVAVMGLFGMMNWLYTWHNPKVDPGSDRLSRQISNVFLRGVLGKTAAGRHLDPRKHQSGRNKLAANRH